MASITRNDANLLPHNLDAERAVLGSILVDPDAMPRVRNVNLLPEEFFSPAHGAIFRAMLDLADDWKPIDVVTLTTMLESRKNGSGTQLSAAGGPMALSELIGGTPTAVHAEHYAGIVKDAACRRKLISTAAQIAEAAQTHSGPRDELYSIVSSLFFGSVDVTGSASHMRGGDDALMNFLNEQIAREERFRDHPDSFMGTGWRDLDDMLDYLEEGCLHVVSAQSSVGKTIYNEQLSEHNAKNGHQVLYYHLEQRHRNMLVRAVARYSGIDVKRLSRGEHGHEVMRAIDAVRPWHKNITYIHCPGWPAERIVADMTRMVAQEGAELAVIDYLQKVRLSSKSGFNSSQVIGEAVETFKIGAETLNIPVVVASQVSRDWKLRGDEKSVGDDTKGSGDIKDKANQLVVLNRKESREERLRREQREGRLSETEIIEVSVEKNTNGPTGNLELVHLLGRLRFVDKAREIDSGDF